MLNTQTTKNFVDKFWDEQVIPALSAFIKIPCKTRTLDPDWRNNDYLQQAVTLVHQWIEKQGIPGTRVQVLSLPHQSPFLFVAIPGTCNSGKTAMFYGHLDKMPEAEGWDEGLGPWQPVLKDDRLYGRGSVDDGYAAFAPIAAIKALQQQNIPYPHCIMLLEASEESGSPDFVDYITQLEKSNSIGTPDVMIFVDAGGDNYDQLWCTDSLRGTVEGILSVTTLTQAVHSGSSSGIAPSAFDIMRTLLSRINNEQTGEVLIEECHVDIPEERIEQTKELAKILGNKIYKSIPFASGVQPKSYDLVELLLNKTWRPTLSITGGTGLPIINDAASVLLPNSTLMLSLRLPPTCNARNTINKLKEILEKDPPYGAVITFTPIAELQGWSAPKMAPWLEETLDSSSLNYYGAKPAYMGDGGSIGIVELLGEKYPHAHFIVSGVASAETGEHGPNEYIYIPAAKKFTCCIAEVLATLAKQK